MAPPAWELGLPARVAALEQQMAQVLQVQAAAVAHAVALSRRLDTPDRDARLLSAIAATVGASVFTARELVMAADPELRAVLAGKDARGVGAWLKRLHREAPPPYVLRRVARDDRGAMWAIAIR